MIVVLVIGAALAAIGCKEKEGEGKGGTSPAKKGAGEKGAAAGPRGKMPEPEPLPKVGPDGVATRFPKIVTVGPPPGLKDRLKLVQDKFLSKNWKDRRDAGRLLQALVKSEDQNAGLARYLVVQGKLTLARNGFRIWRKLKAHPHFVRVMVSLMGHATDSIRAEAVALFAWGVKDAAIKKAAPFMRVLIKDKSCNVRRRALNVLSGKRMKLGLKLQKELLVAFSDPCPAVQALAMQNLHTVVDRKNPDKKIVDQLVTRAKKSPFHLIRCAAMLALGRLKVAKAEKLIAAALADASRPSITVSYADGRTTYTYTVHSSMPSCAADALTAMTGRKQKGKNLDQVRQWRLEMSKRKLSTRAPKNFCLDRKHCKEDQICMNMKCTGLKTAAAAYWKYAEIKHCMPRAPRIKWRNFTDAASEKAGFALHWMAHWKLRNHLRKKDQSAFMKKEKEIRARPCPGRPKAGAAPKGKAKAGAGAKGKAGAKGRAGAMGKAGAKARVKGRPAAR
jgi:hypothetical protein